MDKIILNGCRFYGYHGAFAEEQTLGQIFVVDLELAVDLTKASQSDNLDDTVHYGLVFEAVQKQVEDKKYILIERLAGAICEDLFAQFPQMPEGELTRLRASLVCEPTLAFCAREIELGSFLRLGKGEEMTGGRHRDSVTSDALESVIGAVYLDGGFANAKEFALKYVLNDMEHKKLFFDSKTIFQEMVQGNIPGEISYHPLGESGPDHDKTFSVEVWIGEQCMGQGSGRTKKAAEQMAAYRAICRLKATDNKQKQ